MNINKLNYNYSIPVPPPRPTAQNVTDNLFSTLDPTNKGYFEKSDLTSLFTSTNSGDSSQITNDLFSNFDSNGDGKVTRNELNSVIQQFTGEINSYAQANIQKQADMLPHQHHVKAFDYGQNSDTGAFVGNNIATQLLSNAGTETQMANMTDNGINVSDLDINNDGKITVSEINTYFDNLQNTAVQNASTPQNTVANFAPNALAYPTDREIQMNMLQNYNNATGASRASNDSTSNTSTTSNLQQAV
jgi:EF-hand domain pair/EF hand